MEFIKFLPDNSHSLTFLVKNTSWPSIHMSIHLCNVQLALMYNSRQGWLAAVKPACWHTGPAATVERGGLQRPVHAVPSHSSSPLSIPPSFHSFNLPMSRNLRLYPSSTMHTHYSSMYVFTWLTHTVKSASVWLQLVFSHMESPMMLRLVVERAHFIISYHWFLDLSEKKTQSNCLLKNVSVICCTLTQVQLIYSLRSLFRQTLTQDSAPANK